MDYFHNISVVNTQYERIVINAVHMAILLLNIQPWKWDYFSQVYLWLLVYLRKFLWNTHFLTFFGIHISQPAKTAIFLRSQPEWRFTSGEMPLGPGAEKNGCFRRALHVSSLSTYQFTALISSDLQWLAKLVLVVQLWSLHKISDQKKNVCRRWVVNYGRCVASWLLHLSLNVKQSGFKPWLGTLCCVLGHNALLSQCLSLNPGV